MIIDVGSKKDKKGLDVASYLYIEYRKSRLNGDFYLALSDCSKSTIKKPATCRFKNKSGGGGWARTNDQAVMSRLL